MDLREMITNTNALEQEETESDFQLYYQIENTKSCCSDFKTVQLHSFMYLEEYFVWFTANMNAF